MPASNPFVGRAGARPEIYSYGLRNPWRFSFDRSTGDLTIGDVGQDEIEEIDFAAQGRGARRQLRLAPAGGPQPQRELPERVRRRDAIAPVIELTHADGNCSVTGGYVVRDPRVPALRGRYVYGDFCKGELRAARLSPGAASGDASLGLQKIDALSSFGEDGLGRVYVVSLGGPIYRFVAG